MMTGRQVKMAFVNSVAKPPRDVRRRQEKFGIKNDSTSMSAAPSSTKWVNAALVTYMTHFYYKDCRLFIKISVFWGSTNAW